MNRFLVRASLLGALLLPMGPTWADETKPQVTIPPAARLSPAPKFPTPPAAKRVPSVPRHKPRPRADLATQIELNSATKAQLKSLPGITDALADKIIKARPFLTKAKLNDHILPEGMYWALREKVRVVPPDLATLKPPAK